MPDKNQEIVTISQSDSSAAPKLALNFKGSTIKLSHM